MNLLIVITDGLEKTLNLSNLCEFASVFLSLMDI